MSTITKLPEGIDWKFWAQGDPDVGVRTRLATSEEFAQTGHRRAADVYRYQLIAGINVVETFTIQSHGDGTFNVFDEDGEDCGLFAAPDVHVAVHEVYHDREQAKAEAYEQDGGWI